MHNEPEPPEGEQQPHPVQERIDDVVGVNQNPEDIFVNQDREVAITLGEYDLTDKTLCPQNPAIGRAKCEFYLAAAWGERCTAEGCTHVRPVGL